MRGFSRANGKRGLGIGKEVGGWTVDFCLI